MPERTLILLRHGTSEGNEEDRWTGRDDVDLTHVGYTEAAVKAKFLHNQHIDQAHTSTLRRARNTLTVIEHELATDIPTRIVHELDERDFGDFTGMKKKDALAKLGEARFTELRRSWDTPMPNGESNKDVGVRVGSYLDRAVVPPVLEGQVHLVAGHSNVLRGIIRHIYDIDPYSNEFKKLEVGNKEVDIITFSPRGRPQKLVVHGRNA